MVKKFAPRLSVKSRISVKWRERWFVYGSGY